MCANCGYVRMPCPKNHMQLGVKGFWDRAGSSLTFAWTNRAPIMPSEAPLSLAVREISYCARRAISLLCTLNARNNYRRPRDRRSGWMFVGPGTEVGICIPGFWFGRGHPRARSYFSACSSKLPGENHSLKLDVSSSSSGLTTN